MTRWAELTIRVFIDEDAECPECGGELEVGVDDILVSMPCPCCGVELFLESDETPDAVH